MLLLVFYCSEFEGCIREESQWGGSQVQDCCVRKIKPRQLRVRRTVCLRFACLSPQPVIFLGQGLSLLCTSSTWHTLSRNNWRYFMFWGRRGMGKLGNMQKWWEEKALSQRAPGDGERTEEHEFCWALTVCQTLCMFSHTWQKAIVFKISETWFVSD